MLKNEDLEQNQTEGSSFQHTWNCKSLVYLLDHEWRSDSDLPNIMIANLNPFGGSSQHLMIISTDVPAAEEISN